MPAAQRVSVPLSLDGTHNTRDLGGYRTQNGQYTRKHIFLRSDGIGKLSEADKEALYQYGVRRVLDLRTTMEVNRQADSLMGFRDVEYLNIPLSDRVHDNDGKSLFPPTMGEMYVGLLDNAQQSLRRIFDSFVDYSDGCTLFHCTAGKDRTGTIAMLLLKLAEVDDETIVSDYAATEINMPPWEALRRSASAELGLDLPEHIFRSQASNMEYLLSHLSTAYGGAEEYLLKIGISPVRLSQLKKRFVG